MQIKDYSTQDLKKELERRQQCTQIAAEFVPTLIDNPDLTHVIDLCKEYISDRVEGNYIDEDFSTWLEESLLEALYGKDVYEKLNRIDKLNGR